MFCFADVSYLGRVVYCPRDRCKILESKRILLHAAFHPADVFSPLAVDNRSTAGGETMRRCNSCHCAAEFSVNDSLLPKLKPKRLCACGSLCCDACWRKFLVANSRQLQTFANWSQCPAPKGSSYECLVAAVTVQAIANHLDISSTIDRGSPTRDFPKVSQ